MDTLLYGGSLYHLLEVGVIESTFCPKGDLSLHLLRGQTGMWLNGATVPFSGIENTHLLVKHDRNPSKASHTLVILLSATKPGSTVWELMTGKRL